MSANNELLGYSDEMGAKLKRWHLANNANPLDLTEVIASDLSLRSHIADLEADKNRLDVLEELLRERRVCYVTAGGEAFAFYDQLPDGRSRMRLFPTLTEAADAELLSRREKENG